jgi:hypothetical protein
MNSLTRFAVYMVAFTCAGGAFAQTPDATTDDAAIGSNPAAVAFVYVGNTNEVMNEFVAAADGRLTPAPGATIKFSGSPEAANGKYLFGRELNGKTVDSFLMEPDGALKLVASTDTSVDNPGSCAPNEGSLQVDHSGENLYHVAWDPACAGSATNMRIETFKIDDANGTLAYLSESDGYGAFDPSYQISFLGDNKFAYLTQLNISSTYTISCGVSVIQRLSNGETADLGYANPGPPAPPISGTSNYYCPSGLATDQAGHVAAILTPTDLDGNGTGPTVIGVYTADASGKLSTTNTSKDMPLAPQDAGAIRTSPSGEFLAVGGKGVEIYHLNGAAPVTKYKTIKPGFVTQVLWDNNNHLYVTTTSEFKNLFVYTVTSTGISEAPGSPYTVYSPAGMVVQPK